jgi:predicted TPR repeat methyltransferase
VRATAERAGLTVVDLRAEVLRQEAGKPVDGWIVTARKP